MSAKSLPFLDQLRSWLTANIIAPVLVSLISTALIAGGSYLLFDAQGGLNELGRVTAQFAAQQQATEKARELGRLYTEGWFAPGKGNLDRLRDKLQQLTAVKTQPALDEGIAQPILNWSTDAINTLTAERGRLAGFVFDDTLMRQHQATLVSGHDSVIAAINALREMVIKWPAETAAQRDERLRTFEETLRPALAATGTEETEAKELLRAAHARQRENQRIYEDAERHYRQWQLKLWLSFAVIIIGLLLLAATVFLAWRSSSPHTSVTTASRNAAKGTGKTSPKKRR